MILGSPVSPNFRSELGVAFPRHQTVWDESRKCLVGLFVFRWIPLKAEEEESTREVLVTIEDGSAAELELKYVA